MSGREIGWQFHHEDKELKTTACFIDTNVFYDYASLDSIKWLDVLKAEHVLIILPPVILRELNNHKDGGTNPSRKERAFTTIRYLMKFFKSASASSTVRIRKDAVDLLFWPYDVIVNPPWNPNIGDDQLFASLLHYKEQNPEVRVVFVTSDLGLMGKALIMSIECIELPEHYKLPLPQHPFEKKIKALEDLVAQLQKVPEPSLKVTFENGEQEIFLKADWEEPLDELPIGLHKSFLSSTIYGEAEPPPRGTMALEFRVRSTGTKGAEKIVVFIDLPDDCVNWEQKNSMFALGIRKSWLTFADPEDDHIQYIGPELVHGLSRLTDQVHVTFPDPKRSYEFKWTARAANMREPCTGILRVVPEPEPPPLTPEEKEQQKEAYRHFTEEVIAKKKKKPQDTEQ